MVENTPRRKPPSARQTLRAAADLDARRQAQIDNQIASINRLLVNGSYDTEMDQLHRSLAEAHAELNEARAELARLKSTSGL